MKNFFKLLFASCLGTLLAIGALILIGVLSISGLAAAFEDTEVDIEANSVLVLDPTMIPELTNNVPVDPFSFDSDKVVGLRDMIRVIDNAATNDDIKGIYMDGASMGTRPATSLALREALLRFGESGKFIVSHAKYYSQGDYYLASVADGLYLNPTGGVDARGFGATLPFFKEGLDKLGVDINVFYAGDFKSAGEPFFRNSISDSNRLQTREYLADLWDVWLHDVSKSRELSYEELKRLTEQFIVRSDKDALQYGFVDALYYKDQVLDDLRKRMGLDDDDNIKTVSVSAYFSTLPKLNLSSKNKIAIVYAEGNIVDGKGDQGNIGDTKYTKELRKIRKDDKVKAIVLRVNSGGGSAMASENIWRELQLAREQGIKVVTSMGDYAASGGYYIAAATDSIFAQPNTITGSIGVIGIVPNFARLLDDRLGINFDTVSTGEFSNAFSAVIPYSEKDRAVLQESVDEIYQTFVERVAAGRNLSVERVKQLAKGRVYTGRDALELKLVDRIGGVEDAIAAVARMADLDLDDARIVEYPKVKDAKEQLIEEFTGKDDKDISLSAKLLERELGETYKRVQRLKAIYSAEGPQMIMPELVEVR